jgi:hypothetical protein
MMKLMCHFFFWTDRALEILEIKIDTKLPTAEPRCVRIALQELARKPFAIGSKRQLSLWERCLKYSG